MKPAKSTDTNYQQWLAELKQKIRNSQVKAILKVNAELLSLYWEIGKELIEKQVQSNWGDKIISQLAKDLLNEFPGVKGFSATNLKYIRQWYQFYSSFGQQAVDQLTKAGKKASKKIGQQPVDQLPELLGKIPWGHHIQIIIKAGKYDEAIFYVQQTMINNWSRAVLLHQIESGLYQRKGNAITNFELTLPKVQSDLARESLKSSYLFDFLGLGEDIQERELEKALIQHIKKFMLELGRGFAYVGNQYQLVVKDDDYFLDLLFYNYQLHCFVVFELKVGDFKPEFTGKLNFYINTIDEQIKGKNDNATIGVLLCKTPNETVVKYSLKGMDTPMGVAEYEFTSALPKQLKAEMPSVEELEKELEKEAEEFKENLSPADTRLKAIKEKLKGIKKEEIQTTATYPVLLKLYQEGLKPLYKNIMDKLSAFDDTFYNKSFGWSANNFNTNEIEKLDQFWSEENKIRGMNQLFFEYIFSGFKKAGTENYSASFQLKFGKDEYWYGFGLVNHNDSQPFLKKMYHQPITNEDREQITELLMNNIMDQVEWIIERINKEPL